MVSSFLLYQGVVDMAGSVGSLSWGICAMTEVEMGSISWDGMIVDGRIE